MSRLIFWGSYEMRYNPFDRYESLRSTGCEQSAALSANTLGMKARQFRIKVLKRIGRPSRMVLESRRLES